MKATYAVEGVSPGRLTFVLLSNLAEGSFQIVAHHPGEIREGLSRDTEVVDITINSDKNSMEAEAQASEYRNQSLSSGSIGLESAEAAFIAPEAVSAGTVVNESLDQIKIIDPGHMYPIIVGASGETAPTRDSSTGISVMKSTSVARDIPHQFNGWLVGPGRNSIAGLVGPPIGAPEPGLIGSGPVGPEDAALKRFGSQECLNGFVANREFRIPGRIVDGIKSLVRFVPETTQVHVPCVVILNGTDRSIVNLIYDVSKGTFISTDHHEVVTLSSVTNNDIEQTMISLQDFNCGFLDASGSILYRQPVAGLLYFFIQQTTMIVSARVCNGF